MNIKKAYQDWRIKRNEINRQKLAKLFFKKQAEHIYSISKDFDLSVKDIKIIKLN